MFESITQATQRAREATRGTKTAAMLDAARATGASVATVYRHRARLTVQPARRQRSDAGTTGLTHHEAQLISALLMESHRKNGKRLMTVEQALRVLRYEGLVRAEAVDPATGEVRLLSTSAVERGLRLYALHPRQLLAPAPVTELQSEHPNHVWQIDASLCVLYYLRSHAPQGRGMQVLDADRFYKNKPAALDRVASERVWRYLVTDHFSGSLFCHYVMGAESGVNLSEAFLAATQKRAQDPWHGVPYLLQMDMGSANTGGLFRNLARRLQVRLEPHAPGNARVTGQVECAHNIWERRFESSLKTRPIDTLDQLNAAASMFARWFNATQVHSRFNDTRTSMWLRIRPEQLRVAPPAPVCRELMTHEPEERLVRPTLTVSFGGAEYSVRDVPDVVIGEKVFVAVNPYRDDAACVCLYDANGNETLLSVPLVRRNEAGFREDAPVIGQSYARPADTLADTNRKAIERLAMGAASDEEAAQRRKARTIPFGGHIDPLREAREADLPAAIARHGQALELATTLPACEPARLDATTSMLRIVDAIGRSLSADEYAWFAARYAEGVPEDQLVSLIEQFGAQAEPHAQARQAGGLRAV